MPGGPERSVLHQYDLNKRKDDAFIPGVSDYIVSADKKKILYRSNAAWSIVAVTPKPQPGTGKVNVDDIEVRIDPRAEWNPDLQRSVAHQSRLLLCAEHARR